MEYYIVVKPSFIDLVTFIRAIKALQQKLLGSVIR